MKTAEEYLPEESDLAFEGGIELFLKRKVVSSIEQAQKEAYNQAIEDGKEKILTITGEDNPYPLRDVLERLIWATEYLLHIKNYDGHNYEELGQSVRRAKEIMKSILRLKQRI